MQSLADHGLYLNGEVFIQVIVSFLDSTADIITAVSVASELSLDHREIIHVLLDFKFCGSELRQFFMQSLNFERMLLNLLLVVF